MKQGPSPLQPHFLPDIRTRTNAEVPSQDMKLDLRIRIESLSTREQYEACVDVQNAVWGYSPYATASRICTRRCWRCCPGIVTAALVSG
jgi:hypothetical protein